MHNVCHFKILHVAHYSLKSDVESNEMMWRTYRYYKLGIGESKYIESRTMTCKLTGVPTWQTRC